MPCILVLAILASSPYSESQDATDSPLAAEFKGHKDAVWSLAFDADGKRLVSAGNDGLRIWDMSAKKQIKAMDGNAGHLTSVVFAPDGKTIAWGGDFGKVVLWDVERDKEKFVLDDRKGSVWSLAISPDGKMLAAGTDQSVAVVWDLATGQKAKVFEGLSGDVDMVAFDSTSTHLMAAASKLSARTCEFKVWEIKTWKEVGSLAVRSFTRPKCAAATRDFKRVAVGTWDPVIWDLEDKKTNTVFKGTKRAIDSVAFSPDGKFLASGDQNGVVRIWDVSKGKEIKLFKGQSGRVVTLAFSMDGTFLAAATDEGNVLVWRVAKEGDGGKQ
jgi:WD40 repeat protein